nr:putative zinc finger, CCHC-type [Ipomoea batatas]
MMNSGFIDFAVNIPKLEHFEGVGFRRWQKKMKFIPAALNVAYVLSTLKPVEQENETFEATRRRLKWENDDLACRGPPESSKDLWDVLEAKYIYEDAFSKKFLVSEFNEFRMVDNRSVMEQFHEIVRILGQIRHHGMNMDDSIAIASIIDKLPPSWNKVHRALMQRKEELTMEQLGSHLYVEEGIRQKDSKKKSGGRLIGASVWKEKMQGISSGDHGQGSGQWKQGKIINLISDSTENFIAMVSEVYVMQTDDSWWVDTGATRHV